MDIYFTIISVIILYCNCIFAQSNEYYIGAVVDYNPVLRGDNKVPVHMGNNLKKYETYVAQAKNSKADIIVFPEYGLTTTNVTIDNIVSYTTVFPEPQTKTIACGNNNFSQIFANLSCIARKHEIYLVVNLPERVQGPNKDKKEIYFNTNIVFDRKGALIARYRKYNLFEEPGFSAPEKPELTYFETDFGVTFGTFTCFDILFSQPSLELLRMYKNITDIVYPTAWFSELPFLTAVQTQNGWARANGVNLLAAGYNSPEKGNGGSGIYQPSKNNYVVPSRDESQVIVTSIKKININNRMTDSSSSKMTNHAVKNITNERMNLVVLKENMTQYESLLLNENKTDYEKCHNNLCCTFTVTFTPAKLDYYRLFVYDGMRTMGDMNKRVQICGLAACKDETVETCGDSIHRSTSVKIFNNISISGDFLDKGGSVIFPSQVLYTLDILKPEFYTFSSVKKDNVQSVEMKTTTQLKEILGFGIYSVTTDKDSHHDDGSGTSGWLIFLYVIIALAILFAIIALGIYILRSKNRGNFRNLFQENEN